MLYDKRWDENPATPTTTEPWRQILLDAAKLIKEKGWIRGRFQTNAGFCAVGALRMAAFRDIHPFSHRVPEEECDIFNKAQFQLQRCVGGGIMYWNDELVSNAAEVIAMMHYAAFMPE